MSPVKSPPAHDATAELTALIDTLHRAGRRLEELTAGEIDAVANREGHAYMLPNSQELLRHSDSARLAAILNALPAHIALLDPHGFIVSVNEAWLRFGASNAVQGAGHGVGANYLDICERADGPDAIGALEAAAGIRSVIAGEMSRFSIEYPCDSPVQRRWFLMTVTPLAGSFPGGAVVMHLDITEKERAAQAQRETQQLLDNIIENIPTAVQLKSVRDGFRMQMWNKAAEAMYGVPREDAIGRTVHDLWPEVDAQRMEGADREIVASGRMQDIPDRVAPTRGRGDIHVHLRKVVLRDAGGDPTHLLVVTDDITAQLAQQARLRESEARFRGLTQLSSDWYWEQDEEYRFVSFSGGEQAGKWGATQPHALGLRRWEIPGLVPLGGSWNEHKAGVHAHESFRDFEYQRTREDGTLQYVAASGEPMFDSAGRFTGYRGVAIDITARKLAVQKLYESERRLNDMLEHVQLVSVMLDREARITYCNEYFLSLTGWKREEVIGQNWFERFMPPELGDMRPVFLDLLANLPTAWHVENELYTSSGERRLVRWNNSVLRSGDEVVGVASIGEDITEQKKTQDALRQNEERTRSIVNLALDAVVVMDTSGRILDWNPQAEKTFGWTRDEVVGTPLADTIIPEQHRAAHAHGLQRFLETGKGAILNKRVEITALHRSGHEFPVELAISPVRLADSWVFSAFIRDLTDRKDAERRITRLNRVYSVLSGINTLIVRVRDRDELFRESCRIAVEQGRFVGAWIGILDRPTMRIARVASSGVDDAFFAQIQGRLSVMDDAPAGYGAAAAAFREKRAIIVNDVENDPFVVHKRAHADQGIRGIVSLPLVVNDEAVGVFCLHAADAGVFDVGELKLLAELTGDIAYAINYIDKHERLDYLAYYDVLTGLANRRLFLERVAQYMRSAATGKHGLALFLLDVERFKSINDSLGQPAGDALLKQVAAWLTLTTGDANLVARLGADHFAMVLPAITSTRSVETLIEKALKGFLEHSFSLDAAEFRIAAKVGAALYPEDGVDADLLLKHAEAALKKAKATGKRYLFYTQDMAQTSAGALTLENQLRHALERQEFVLHFQPKMNLGNGRLTGAEALIRWNDPQTGLVPPGRFIPVLEETGLIHEVGRWALRKAVEDYLRWRAAGLPAVRVAVNVSPLQLRDRGFVDEVRRAIDIDPHAAAGLELEITESLIMEDVKNTIASLEAIRAMGVTIAIDDFGTGYSSLSYLAKLPVDTLKIDRAFVVDMTTGPQGLSLVSTIVTLAHSLKLKVVAEGVETEEQSGLLRDLLCDEVQGYLFGKPVASADFEARHLPRP